jgi:ribosomal protein S27AE
MHPFRDYRPVIQASPPGCPAGRCATCDTNPAQLRHQFLQTVRRSWNPREIATLRTAAHLTPETCDRCGPGVIAAYRADRVGELYLCGHCASHHWPALSAQGWTFWPLGVHTLAPQASAPPAPRRAQGSA